MDVPSFNFGDINYSLLLNLVSACNTADKTIIYGFVSKYNPEITQGKFEFFDRMIDFAMSYYHDFIAPSKKFLKPEGTLLTAVSELVDILIAKDNTATSQDFQQVVYDIGKKYEFEIKEWFSLLYQITLGSTEGPRLGSFVALLGVKNFCKLLPQL